MTPDICYRVWRSCFVLVVAACCSCLRHGGRRPQEARALFVPAAEDSGSYNR